MGMKGHNIVRRLSAAAFVLAAGGFSIARAGEPVDAPACFDAEVSAHIIRQTPIPDCGVDCIVMSWPWILQLDVEEVVRGSAPTGRLMVLAVQHTYLRTDMGGRLLLLRRNSRKGFNLLRVGPEDSPKFCGRGMAPATPYIDADRDSLNKMEQEGLRTCGRGDGVAERRRMFPFCS